MGDFDTAEKQELYQKLKKIESQEFTGWDFSSLGNRYTETSVSWDYKTLVLEKMPRIERMLDMGTGGGELLSTLSPFPLFTAATEAYEPNIPVAKTKLESLGIQVVRIGGDNIIPYAENTFDLVINRHEEYLVSEVHRVLRPGGVFITQQVGGGNNNDINRALGAKLNDDFLHWQLDYAKQELLGGGFHILENKEEPIEDIFTDVEALVSYLNAIPWQVADFSVDKYFEGLWNINQKIIASGSFRSRASRFLLISRKPA